MKTNQSLRYVAGLVALSFATLAASSRVMSPSYAEPTNRSTATGLVDSVFVGHNPLRVNNRLLDTYQLTTLSRGTLTVVTESADGAEASNIPFRVYIKRYGEVTSTADYKRVVTEIDLRQALTGAHAGDWLIIEPAHPTPAVRRQSLLLRDPFFNLFSFLNKGEC